jgi:hypothetical protein
MDTKHSRNQLYIHMQVLECSIGGQLEINLTIYTGPNLSRHLCTQGAEFTIGKHVIFFR